MTLEDGGLNLRIYQREVRELGGLAYLMVSVGTIMAEAAPSFVVFERWAPRTSPYLFIRHRRGAHL
jgi:hypothetical protein